MKEFYVYLLTVPVFFAIDMVWLGLVANKFYQKQIGSMLKETPNWTAAIIFYLIYIVGIVVFAVLPNVDKGPLRAAIMGGLFGFIAYATYDLTNLATMKNWPLTITIVDLIWGSALTATVALASYFIAKWVM